MKPKSKGVAAPKSPNFPCTLDIVPHVLLYLEVCPMSEKANVEAL